MINSKSTVEVTYPQPNIAQLVLNRPSVLNAINTDMMCDLRDLWSELSNDADDLRCIILTGKGDKAFCAGADMKQRYRIDVATWRQQHALLEQAMLAMIDCPVPVIAAVNGYAFGGGFELVLACDFAYASESATFSLPETRLGIMPGAMGTQHLPDACGVRRAKELSYTGIVFSAHKALQWGIVNSVFQDGILLEAALSTARMIARNAPISIRQVKKSIGMCQTDIRDRYKKELDAYDILVATEDRVEGVRAFNEKRDPQFSGK